MLFVVQLECGPLVKEQGIMQSFVPFRAVFQIVAVVAEQLIAFLQPLRRLDAQDPTESGVGEIREPRVRNERVVDFVSESGAVVLPISVLQRNVQNLLLLLV